VAVDVVLWMEHVGARFNVPARSMHAANGITSLNPVDTVGNRGDDARAISARCGKRTAAGGGVTERERSA
jgi:hypothetical protein